MFWHLGYFHGHIRSLSLSGLLGALVLKVSPGSREGRGPWGGCAGATLKALGSAPAPTVPGSECLSFHWIKWESKVCIIHRETSTWRQQQRAGLLLLQNIYITERGREWKWTMCIIQYLSAIEIKYVLFFFYNLLGHLFNLWGKFIDFFFPGEWNTLFKYKWICHILIWFARRLISVSLLLQPFFHFSNSTERLFSDSLCCFFFMWLVAHWNKLATLLLA